MRYIFVFISCMVLACIFIFVHSTIKGRTSNTLGTELMQISKDEYEKLTNARKNQVGLRMTQNQSKISAIPLKKYRRGITEYSQAFYDRLRGLTSRKAGSRDPQLIQLVREIIDQPSYVDIRKPTRYLAATPQVKEVEELLNEMRNGFFFECGALDGERSSNSFYLENKYNWTGVLVEMDPYFYTQLLGKNRRSWSINACLSPYDYVTELPFYGDPGGRGKVSLEKNTKSQSVPCFPFETIMLAINRNHIDYFSLDVEGVEFPILKTIPFDKVTVDVMSVEYSHDADGKNATEKFMTDKGFRVHKDIQFSNAALHLYVEDFIFVRKNLQVSPKKSV